MAIRTHTKVVTIYGSLCAATISEVTSRQQTEQQTQKQTQCEEHDKWTIIIQLNIKHIHEYLFSLFINKKSKHSL